MNAKPNFKDYKIKVENTDESKEVQRLLFILGYTWPFSKTDRSEERRVGKEC